LNFVDPNVMVPGCAPPTALLSLAHDFWNQSNLFLVILVTVVYPITYSRMYIAKRRRLKQMRLRTRLAFRATRTISNELQLIKTDSSSTSDQVGGVNLMCVKTVCAKKFQQLTASTRLMRSLLLVVLVYVSTWAMTMTIIFLVTALQMSRSVVFHASMYAGILATINVGCNFYIYYARSHEYRRAFNAVLCCCFTPSIRRGVNL